ncbi:hypothetical protein KSF78_0000217 [Schistosoma japonicum]|nr:hypothetical protein KSF78_0000217 [Schistosoma japonicum]
MDGILQPS